MKTGAELIANERQEQIIKHDRSVERDIKENPNKELIQGAIALLDEVSEFPEHWDKTIVKRMENKDYKDRLIIAGALIAAEIDRITTEE